MVVHGTTTLSQRQTATSEVPDHRHIYLELDLTLDLHMSMVLTTHLTSCLISSRACSCSVRFRWCPWPWGTTCSQPGVRGWAGSWRSPPCSSSPDTWSTCSSPWRAPTRRWEGVGFTSVVILFYFNLILYCLYLFPVICICKAHWVAHVQEMRYINKVALPCLVNWLK